MKLKLKTPSQEEAIELDLEHDYTLGVAMSEDDQNPYVYLYDETVGHDVVQFSIEIGVQVTLNPIFIEGE